MSSFGKNLMITLAVHVALIGGLVVWEAFGSRLAKSPSSTEILIPADILGDLPKGAGQGKGAYAPPAKTSVQQTAGPSEAMVPGDESPAPKPDEISIPKPKAKPVPPTKAVATTKKPVTTDHAQKSAPTKAPSAGDIRERFANALKAAEAGGTPYGDGKKAGGGNAKAGDRIGSPNGSPDGVIGGSGAGTAFWQYYLHVHDKMYEAWEQPGTLLDKKLVAKVLLRVARDGSIAEVSLKNSSGNKLMDESALSAARKVGLLEPPPDALVKDSFANITVDFQVES
jgi:TonB family protein